MNTFTSSPTASSLDQLTGRELEAHERRKGEIVDRASSVLRKATSLSLPGMNACRTPEQISAALEEMGMQQVLAIYHALIVSSTVPHPSVGNAPETTPDHPYNIVM